MQPSGFPLADAALIPGRPRLLFQICWTAGGNSTAPNHWYTVTDRMRGAWKASPAGRQYELDAVESGTMSLSLDNLDGAFDPDNAASPFTGYVLPYRRIRLVAMAGPSQNLMWPWVATAAAVGGANQPWNTNIVAPAYGLAASTGTFAAASGLAAAVSGLTTAMVWTVPSGTATGAVFGLAGATQSWTTTDSQAFTVTPGAPYSAGLDVRLAAGGPASMAMRLRIRFYDLLGNVLMSASTGATITTTGARITATGTAPAGAAFGIPYLLTDAATVAITTVQATAWQWEQAAAATAYADPGAWGQLWAGLVERWPQTYPDGRYGLVDIDCVDALAPLSQQTMNGQVMGTAVALTGPQYRWDLGATEASPDITAGTAYPELGGTGPALDIVGTAAITGVTIASTTDLGTLWNTPGPVITLSNNLAASGGGASGATCLQPAGGTPIVPASGGWTRMICFRTASTPGTGGTYTLATLWAATAPGFLTTGDRSGAYLFINSSGNVGFNIVNAAGVSLSAANSFVSVCDGNWHCAVWSLSADGLTGTLVVDGQVWVNTAATSVASSTYTADAIGTLLVSGGTNTQPFNGDLAWAAQWATAISQSYAIMLSAGFATGWAGDTAGTRVPRLLGLAGFQSLHAVTYAGVTTSLGAVTATGQGALDLINEACATGVDQFVMDRTGAPHIYGHLWRWLQSTPVVTFGELTATGEIPYQGGVEFAQDPAHLYNDIQVTVEGCADLTDSNALQEAQDTTSQAAYFTQSLPLTINPQLVAGGMTIAEYLLSQYKDPHTRLSGLSVNLAGNPAQFTKLMALNFADLVQVNKRPTLAPMKSLPCFIEQTTWSGDDTGALAVAYQMSPASQQRYWMVSATWAALTTGPAAGVSVITTGPITGNAAIPAQYVLPAGYALTLGYGTAAAETVTVASVQTVTAGYTTVQITLAAPTTQPHTAGDLLCDPLLPNVVLPPAGTYPTCLDALSELGGTSPLIGF